MTPWQIGVGPAIGASSFPEPVISMSIEPATKADQEKMSVGLQRLAEEDPTFGLSTNEETGQTIISGMGELHLEIIRDPLFREFKVEANAGKPQIAYRETMLSSSDGEGKFIRQSGGRGQYGHAVIKLEPLEKGKGVELENKIVGGSIPKEFIKPTFDGIKEASLGGVVAGYPVIDFKITLVDGSFPMSILLKWHSRWPVSLPLRMPCKRRTRFF